MRSSSQAWRCGVCGYIERDAGEPCQWCPICGADTEAFEPFTEATAPTASAATAAVVWQCLVCGYAEEGEQPPAQCPVCGAPADQFEPADEHPQSTPVSGSSRVVIVGAGIAGVAAAAAVRQTAPDAEIILVSNEAELPYYRLNLTRYLAGDVTARELPLHPADWYVAKQVDLRLGAEVAELLPAPPGVRLRSGEELTADAVVVTAGAHPFMPPLKGSHREGVGSFRTLADAQRIGELSRGRRCVCIGGGILGLETAGALARRGEHVVLLEGFDHLMPRQLNRPAADVLATHVASLGVTVRTRAATDELVGDVGVAGVRLVDGDVVDAGLVVIATGVRSNSYLARRAGLQVNRGLVVGDDLAAATGVYAAGDVAEHRGRLYGNWAAAQYQGRIAGTNAAGGQAAFGGIPRAHMLKILGIDMVSIGRIRPEDGSDRLIEVRDDGGYRGFVFRDQHLEGAVLVGDATAASAARVAIEGRRDCSAILRRQPSAVDVADFLLQVQR